MDKLVQISKRLSYFLRHHPEDLDLQLDAQGYTSITVDELADRIGTTPSTIRKIVDQDEKVRFTIRNNRIRANYGHTIKLGAKIYENTLPIPKEKLPSRLYHGTTRKVIDSILKNGLQSQSRQFVHLSYTKDWARKVGNRRSGEVVILEINVKEAVEAGLEFYDAGPVTVLTTQVPPSFVTEMND